MRGTIRGYYVRRVGTGPRHDIGGRLPRSKLSRNQRPGRTRLRQSVTYDGARVIADGKVRTYDMSGRSDTDSPHHGGQAVARAAKTPRSIWPGPSPITPVHESGERRSGSGAV